jgi:hypothetical protein
VPALVLGVLVALIAAIGLVSSGNSGGNPAVAASQPAAVPGGWHWFTSPDGLRVMLPLEFPPTVTDDGLVVTADGSRPRLDIDVLDHVPKNLLEQLTSDETLRRGWKNYRRLRIERTAGGADWEYTYTSGADSGGTDVHGVQKLIVDGDRMYRILWETPAAVWESELGRLTMIVQSLQPTPGG